MNYENKEINNKYFFWTNSLTSPSPIPPHFFFPSFVPYILLSPLSPPFFLFFSSFFSSSFSSSFFFLPFSLLFFSFFLYPFSSAWYFIIFFPRPISPSQGGGVKMENIYPCTTLNLKSFILGIEYCWKALTLDIWYCLSLWEVARVYPKGSFLRLYSGGIWADFVHRQMKGMKEGVKLCCWSREKAFNSVIGW